MNLSDLGNRRGAAGADGPDRFISHDQRGGGGIVGDRAVKLAADHLQRAARVALRLGFTDADDRGQTGDKGGLRLGFDQGVAFAMAAFAKVGAAFGMAEDDISGPRIAQHGSRDVTGMGTRGVRVAILPAQCQVRPFGRPVHLRQQRGGRT